MAFMDDAEFVISQIRHSCVTSDDTGMSEIVIVNEETENEKLLQRRKFGNWYIKEGENGDFAYSNSFDIDVSPGMDRGIRTNSTEAKVPGGANPGKRYEIKCPSISWKDPEHISDSELSKLFVKKDIHHHDKKDGKRASKLSVLVESALHQPKNPFLQYGKFDGEGYAKTNKVKVFKIFFPLPAEKGNQQAMNVCLIVGGARVQDLIGLIMFKYTEQERQPELKDDVKSYCLLIADEMDGEVDFDLPPLDSKEMITKFDFRALALSYTKSLDERMDPKPANPADTGIIVEVCEEKRGSSKFAVDSWDLCMKVVMEKMLKKRGIKRTGHEYVLVKKSEPGSAIDLEATLESMDTLEFQLVKRTSIPTKTNNDKNGKIVTDQAEAEFFTSAQYKAFKVTMLQGFLHAKSEVQLGIDSRNIEITQTTQSNQRPFWNRSPRAVNVEMDYVVHTEIIRKSGTRSIFRITYSTVNHDFKNYEFESPHVIAGEIVRKIKLILNSSAKSDSWVEYQKVKDKRAKRS